MTFFLYAEVYCIVCLITTAPQELASTASLAFATSIPPKAPSSIPMGVRYILKYSFLAELQFLSWLGRIFEKVRAEERSAEARKHILRTVDRKGAMFVVEGESSSVTGCISQE